MKESLLSLSDAMQAWTGWNSDQFPCLDDARFSLRYGVDAAEKWLSVLHALKNDFYASTARYTAANLQEMSDMATMQFRKMHPEVDDAIVKALAWCYTFDNK